MNFPALRNIDIYPVNHEEQQFLCLRDPEGFVEEQLLLTPAAFFIAAMLNGQRSVLDIQHAFAQRFDGQLLFSNDIESTVETLDQHGFLFSERFWELRDRVLQDFQNNPVRAAYLAGKSYPDDPSTLRSFLAQQFTREGAPGTLPGSSEQAEKPLRGLIAPHIDFHRGGHSYAHAYTQLSRYRKPEIVLIFGVAHAGPPAPFILTRKKFDTPLGSIETDAELVETLAASCSWNPWEHEIVHRTEHSIEFQIVMLSLLYGPNVRIVPVLCGNFENGLTPEILNFLETCKHQLEGRDATVLAAADLAHVGKRFGDGFDISENIIREIQNRDQADLQNALAGRAEAFYNAVMADQNARRVCGIYAIYSAVQVIGSAGTLLHYSYAHDPSGGIVSFASIAYP
ncbi:AmmeMemoRadiSam system protein B [bacterium]|nr:AmmeMemoRadiSam system protein B [bacterium]MCI0603508.1 AmmeMemoRadiSam system protein B [bacterium]